MSSYDSNAIYPVDTWDNYAELFASITTSLQLAVYKEVCLHLRGTVIDCGCGSAKIAPFLAADERVFSYTGVDSSRSMVKAAQRLLQKIQHPRFDVWQRSIESMPTEYFTSGVSIQSYYSWSEPIIVLQAIHRILAPQAVFILVTPNRQLPVEALAKETEQELLVHPDFTAYRTYNLQLAMNSKANFVDMDDLVGQVRQVGFQVQEVHQRHFRGGLNFLVLTKAV